MPLFSWMKWSRSDGDQTQEDSQGPPESPPAAAAEAATAAHTPGSSSPPTPPPTSRMLIRELLWHVEERERLAREVEREQRLAHGALGYRWLQSYPRLRTLIPASDRHQLERLCARIPPIHTAMVLSRFREVLATNNILPWELVYVFKQVLQDFLDRENGEAYKAHCSPQPARLRPMEAWTNRYQMRQGFVTPTVPNCYEPPREEIPTISGYVDHAMRCSRSFDAPRDWDIPSYNYSVPTKSRASYSTTL